MLDVRRKVEFIHVFIIKRDEYVIYFKEIYLDNY